MDHPAAGGVLQSTGSCKNHPLEGEHRASSAFLRQYQVKALASTKIRDVIFIVILLREAQYAILGTATVTQKTEHKPQHQKSAHESCGSAGRYMANPLLRARPKQISSFTTTQYIMLTRWLKTP